MPLDDAEFAAFKALVETDASQTELACSPYLSHATDYLLPATPVRTVELKQELRSPYGRSDYIVIADIKTGTGPIQRFVYFWELKAPQAALMQRDDAEARYRPTKDLITAETQLIHYLSEARESGDFRKKFDIRYAENIRAGGIIIGRDERIANGQAASQESAAHSFKLRQNFIYDVCSFKILTWDRILEFVAPPAATA